MTIAAEWIRMLFGVVSGVGRGKMERGVSMGCGLTSQPHRLIVGLLSVAFCYEVPVLHDVHVQPLNWHHQSSIGYPHNTLLHLANPTAFIPIHVTYPYFLFLDYLCHMHVPRIPPKTMSSRTFRGMAAARSSLFC